MRKYRILFIQSDMWHVESCEQPAAISNGYGVVKSKTRKLPPGNCLKPLNWEPRCGIILTPILALEPLKDSNQAYHAKMVSTSKTNLFRGNE